MEEEVKPDEEVADWSKPDYKFVPSLQHKWHQEGYYLICSGCDLDHGIFIGADKRMIGEKENGEPILQNLKID